ncbi:LysR family transcriptional regulator [Roseimicrobium gellanilyticum]|uniref:LysR family transcriptional regulator n=1 Tax=Roseimicrobium gellanilyticum TaxID=748857 RepID=A0A366HNW4_9BACT|nr:LysR family transcriptional regulator [Roseimicrobium gellanilyticum]RBP44265.1 LysR family transcriptional regulator [Roseimicrobium gellanilyticum]
MEQLNFHHLRYFWMVARKGSVRRAAEELHVSQPAISAQLRSLEESLGEKLFQRKGRGIALTEAGQMAMAYADDIFSAGRELVNSLKHLPGNRKALRLNVGMTDALSKQIAFEILKPAFQFAVPTHVVCRQAELAPLIHQLHAHRLDIVLSDEPASSGLKSKVYNHRLGRSGVTFCAAPSLVPKLRRNFPRSLHNAPALLPSENMGGRIALDTWFDSQSIRPKVVAEFESATLMMVAAAQGELGFTAIPTAVSTTALKQYGLKVIARVEECGSDYFAITTERRVRHPVAAAITGKSHAKLFPMVNDA